MKVKSESEVAQSCPTLSDPMDCSPPGSSVPGIFQARVLELGAIAFSVIPLASFYPTSSALRKPLLTQCLLPPFLYPALAQHSSPSFLVTSLWFRACPSFMLSSLSSPYFISVSPFFSFLFPFFSVFSHFSVFFIGSLFFIVVSSSSPFFHLISPFGPLTQERLSYKGGKQETLEMLLGPCRHLVKGLVLCWALLEVTKLRSQDWPDIYGRHIYFPGV